MSNGNLFTFGYYGYTVHSATAVHFTGHAALRHLLAHDAVDGVGSPLLYRSTARGPSGATITHGPWDTPSVRGKVWVVEAELKSGTSHLYPRRTFYIDEDSWQILVVDQYDARGEVWRVSEGHCINYYDEPTFWTTLEVHTDLVAGRYLAIGLDNESSMYDFEAKRKPNDYTPASLRRGGLR